MRDWVNPLRDLFDAAVRHRSIKLTCTRCAHVQIVSAHALWHLYEQRGWKDDFRSVQERSVCALCFYKTGERVRRPHLELTDEDPTDKSLALPSEMEWKRAQRMRR